MEPIRVSVIFDARGEPQLRRAAGSVAAVSQELHTLSAQSNASGRVLRLVENDLNRFGMVAHRMTSQGVMVMNQAFERTFGLFNQLGRMTFYALIAQVAGVGFALKRLSREFFEINEGFAGLEITLKSVFRSSTVARNIRQELARITITSPLPFENLADAVRAGAVMPTLTARFAQDSTAGVTGQQSFMGQYVELLEQLTTFRPDKLTADAVFALREALTGELRSLVRRFEFPASLLVNASGQSIEVLKKQPELMFSALKGALDKIISPQSVREIAKQPSKLYANILEQAVQIPLLQVGRSGEERGDTSIYQRILDFGFSMLNRFGEFADVRGGPFTAQADRISKLLIDVFERSTVFLERRLEQMLSHLGVGLEDIPGASKLERIYRLFETMIQSTAQRLPKLIDSFIEFGTTALPVVQSFLKMLSTIVKVFASLFNFNPALGLAGLIAYRALPDIVRTIFGSAERAFIESMQNIRGAMLSAALVGGSVASTVGGVNSGSAAAIVGNARAYQNLIGRNPFLMNQEALEVAGNAGVNNRGRMTYGAAGNYTGAFGQQYTVTPQMVGRTARLEHLPQNAVLQGGHSASALLQQAGMAVNRHNELVWAPGNQHNRPAGRIVSSIERSTFLNTPALNMLGMTNLDRFRQHGIGVRNNQMTGLAGLTMPEIMRRLRGTMPVGFDQWLQQTGVETDRRGRQRWGANNAMGFQRGTFVSARDFTQLLAQNGAFLQQGALPPNARPGFRQSFDAIRGTNRGISASVGAAFGAGTASILGRVGVGAAAAGSAGIAVGGAAAGLSAVLWPIAAIMATTGILAFLIDKGSAYLEGKRRQQVDETSRLLGVTGPDMARRTVEAGAESYYFRQLSLSMDADRRELKAAADANLPLQIDRVNTLNKISDILNQTVSVERPTGFAEQSVRPNSLSPDVLQMLNQMPIVRRKYEESVFLAEAGAIDSVPEGSLPVNLRLPTFDTLTLNRRDVQQLLDQVSSDIAKVTDYRTAGSEGEISIESIRAFETDTKGNKIETALRLKNAEDAELASEALNRFSDSLKRVQKTAREQIDKIYTTESGQARVRFGAQPTASVDERFDRFQEFLINRATPAGFLETNTQFDALQVALRASEESPDLRQMIETTESFRTGLRDSIRPLDRLLRIAESEVDRTRNLTKVIDEVNAAQYDGRFDTAAATNASDVDLQFAQLQEIINKSGVTGLAFAERIVERNVIDPETGRDKLDPITKQPITRQLTFAEDMREIAERQGIFAQTVPNNLKLTAQEALIKSPLNILEATLLTIDAELAQLGSAGVVQTEQFLNSFEQGILSATRIMEKAPDLFHQFSPKIYDAFAALRQTLPVADLASGTEAEFETLELRRTEALKYTMDLMYDAFKGLRTALPPDLKDLVDLNTEALRLQLEKLGVAVRTHEQQLMDRVNELTRTFNDSAFDLINQGGVNFDTTDEASVAKPLIEAAQRRFQERYKTAPSEYAFDFLQLPTEDFDPAPQPGAARRRGHYEFLTERREVLETRIATERRVVTPETAMALKLYELELDGVNRELAALQRTIILADRAFRLDNLQQAFNALETLTQAEFGGPQGPNIYSQTVERLQENEAFSGQTFNLSESFLEAAKLSTDRGPGSSLANAPIRFDVFEREFARLAEEREAASFNATITEEERGVLRNQAVAFRQMADEQAQNRTTFRGDQLQQAFVRLEELGRTDFGGSQGPAIRERQIQRFQTSEALSSEGFNVSQQFLDATKLSSERGLGRSTSNEVTRLIAFREEYSRLADEMERRSLEVGLDRTEIERLEELGLAFRQMANEAEKAQEQITGRGGILESFREGFLETTNLWTESSQNWTQQGAEMANALSQGLSNSLLDIVMRAEDAGEAFRQFGVALLETAARLVLNKTVESLLGTLFSGFGTAFGGGLTPGTAGTPTGPLYAPGMADGGLIPGASSDVDNRLIFAGTGEFIIPSKMVRKYGAETFEEYRKGKVPAFADGGMVGKSLPVNNAFNRVVPKPPAFANGGLVQPLSMRERIPMFADGGIVMPLPQSEGGSNINVPVNVTVNIANNGEVTSEENSKANAESGAQNFARGLQLVVKEQIIRETRQGGSFANMRGQRR